MIAPTLKACRLAGRNKLGEPGALEDVVDGSKPGGRAEALVQLGTGFADDVGQLRIMAEDVLQVLAVGGRGEAGGLHLAVGDFGREAVLLEQHLHPLRGVGAAGQIDVFAHAVAEDRHVLDDAADPAQLVIHDAERVGNDDALCAGVRDVALVRRGDELGHRVRVAAHHDRESADVLDADGVLLVRHRARAFLALAERLADLADLGLAHEPEILGDLLDHAGDHRQLGDDARAVVDGHDLGGDDRGEVERLGYKVLHLGAQRAKHPHGTRQLHRPGVVCDDVERASGPLEHVDPVEDLDAEGDGLGVLAVGTTHHGQILVSQRLLGECPDQALELLVDHRARGGEEQRHRRLLGVVRGHTIVKPAGIGAVGGALERFINILMKFVAGHEGREIILAQDDLASHHLDEGVEVMADLAVAPLDALDHLLVDPSRLLYALGGSGRNLTDFLAGHEHGDFHGQPEPEFHQAAFPDLAHLFAPVPGDHVRLLSAIKPFVGKTWRLLTDQLPTLEIIIFRSKFQA